MARTAVDPHTTAAGVGPRTAAAAAVGPHTAAAAVGTAAAVGPHTAEGGGVRGVAAAVGPAWLDPACLHRQGTYTSLICPCCTFPRMRNTEAKTKKNHGATGMVRRGSTPWKQA